MPEPLIRFGIIGCGLMAREFASAIARWLTLLEPAAQPRIVAIADRNPDCMRWFTDRLPGIALATTDYQELLADSAVDAVYCALPHHLHAQVYCDIIAAGKHLLGEKPFGIDLEANNQILASLAQHPAVFVRCSSEFPFYPGACSIVDFLRRDQFGKIIEVEAGFWHSSDLDPAKPINWKRRVASNGAYGCMGDLGMHVLHIPLRFGWMPRNVRSLLTKVYAERPDGQGGMTPCETWDNAVLSCEVETKAQRFPMLLSTKRIAPGETNTWFIRILGTRMSAEFSTKFPRSLRTMRYRSGGPQGWQTQDLGYTSAYPTITGSIFEFGFPDSMLQMTAAFCDELTNGTQMKGPFACVLPEETALHHRLLTAALRSGISGEVVTL